MLGWTGRLRRDSVKGKNMTPGLKEDKFTLEVVTRQSKTI